MMSELKALQMILAYIAENKLNSALEAEVENMVVEAKNSQVPRKGAILVVELEPLDKLEMHKDNVDEKRLDCIYGDEPLGLEKEHKAPTKMQPQDPL